MRAAIACGLLLLFPVLTGCADPAKVISAASYRNAVERGLETELAQRGITLTQRPDCHSAGAEHTSVAGGFSVRCKASTSAAEPVAVEGAVTGAGTAAQHETYLVRLGGAELFRADCLGAGCHRDSTRVVRP